MGPVPRNSPISLSELSGLHHNILRSLRNSSLCCVFQDGPTEERTDVFIVYNPITYGQGMSELRMFLLQSLKKNPTFTLALLSLKVWQDISRLVF